MASSLTTDRGTTSDRGTDGTFRRNTTERRTTETKASFKTTEFFAYLAVLAGILRRPRRRRLRRRRLRRPGVLALRHRPHRGYMLSRGLAKSGSRDPYTPDRDDR